MELLISGHVAVQLLHILGVGLLLFAGREVQAFALFKVTDDERVFLLPVALERGQGVMLIRLGLFCVSTCDPIPQAAYAPVQAAGA